MLSIDQFEAEADLTTLPPAWDELACACRLPYGTPAWMLAWWRHLAPPQAQLRVVTVNHGEELVGLAGMYIAPEGAGSRHVRLLGARYGGTPLGPLAQPGSEPEVARAIGSYLDSMRPAPHGFHLDGIPVDSPWPALIADAWGGHPLIQQLAQRPTPTVRTGGMTFDEWMASKSKNFRQEMRRKRRQLDDQGAVFRISTTLEEVDRDLDSFLRLHESRWEWRGGSGRLRPRTKEFLSDLARQLLPLGRFRLWSIDVEGASISTHLFVAGGGRANYWLGGFDDAWARYSPAMVALLAAIEHAIDEGDTEIGLGAGRQAYKSRFTGEAEQLEWLTTVPVRSFGSPRVWAGVVPELVTRGASNRLSPANKERLKSLTGRSKKSSA